jgi:branched-chain amino acid transport system ATP-binding protein
MSYLRAENVTVKFGGLHALNNVNLEIEEGQLLSIIGPNGAGKTTLINCISGLYKYVGEIYFQELPLSMLAPSKIAKLGIGRTFQNIELFRNATVLENLMVGRFLKRRTNMLSEMLFLPKLVKQELYDRQKVEDVLDFLEIEAYRDQIISTLPYGVQKLVEIGRTLATEPKLLILDEPTSGLNTDESEDLMWWITDLKEERGINIILIEHDMRVVMTVSDLICVLDHGSVIAFGNPREIQEDQNVKVAYLGG